MQLTMAGECWAVWQLNYPQASNSFSTCLLSCTITLGRAVQWSSSKWSRGLLLICRERDVTWQSVMLTSLGNPSDSSRGCSRPQWSSKCLNMKLLAYSVSSQRSQSLACQSIVSRKKNLSWLICSFILYLSLWVRLLINVDSYTALSHCLPLNSPSLETLTPHIAFQNRPSETQEPEAHMMLLRRAPVTICADSRAREGAEDSWSIPNEKVKLQSPVTSISCNESRSCR